MNARGLCFLALALLISSSASAFKRSQDPDTGVCLKWRSNTFSFSIQEDCYSQVERNSCLVAVRAAIDVWNTTDCTALNAVYAGTTDRRDVGFDETDWGNNINLVVFVEDNWEHARSAIGLTTTTYDVNTGEIVDADVEFNADSYPFTTVDSASTMMDIQNTMAHEAGHMMGLDHSKASEATMYSTAPEGETQKRSLSQDDIDGICFVYPLSGSAPDFVDDSLQNKCEAAPKDTGCRSVPGQSGQGSFAFLMIATGVAVLGLCWRRRRNRQEGRPLV